MSLKVVRVDCGPYLGEIKVIQSDNVFDEKLTLRHSGDFGGDPEQLHLRVVLPPGRERLLAPPPPSPQTGQLHGWILCDSRPRARRTSRLEGRQPR